VKPTASPLALVGGDKAGLELCGPADCGLSCNTTGRTKRQKENSLSADPVRLFNNFSLPVVRGRPACKN
jgi:hypothetical protein